MTDSGLIEKEWNVIPARGQMRASVIIPTFGRPRRLADCLAALAGSDMDGFEVVVVDDGSEPPVESVVEAAAASGLGLRYIRQENRGCGPAKETGATHARSDVLLFTDDDCRPMPDWVRRLVDAVEREPDALVGGTVRNGLHDNIYAEVSQNLVSFLLERGAGSAEGEVSYFTGNNIGCTKRAFDAVGGFDTRIDGAGDDRELGLRWRATGRPLVHVPEAIVMHYHQMTLRSFWRQHVHYGVGIRTLRSRDAGGRHRFSRPSYYLDLIVDPVRRGRSKVVARMGLNLLSQIATAYGMVRGDRKVRH